jgi:hypothetical protein
MDTFSCRVQYYQNNMVTFHIKIYVAEYNEMKCTVTCINDYRRDFELVNRFIDHLQGVSTNNYNTIADFHTTNHTTRSLLSLLSLVVAR